MSGTPTTHQHETTLEPVTSLTPHPENPRRGATAAIVDSIRANGFYGALIAQRSTRHVIAGNHRLAAAIEAGMDAVPVIWLDVTDDQARRILLADNRTSDLATYDEAALAALLSAVNTSSDLTTTGYSSEDLDRLLRRITPDEDDSEDADAKLSAADEIQARWQVQPGDTFAIPTRTGPADHTIHCGDSTDPRAVERAMNGRLADLIFTDPPYGVKYTGRTEDALTLVNDDMTETALRDLLTAAFTAWPLKPGGAYYVTTPSGPLHAVFDAAARATGHLVRQRLVWIKNAATFGRSHYHYQHEPILYGHRAGGTPYFTPDRTQTSVHPAPKPLSQMNPDELRDLVRDLRRQVKTDVWHEDRPPRNTLHPTAKPIHLVTRAAYNSSRPGEIIFDGFTGSGTTALAAEATGRTFAGLELDPRYVAVTLERFHQRGLTPRKTSSDPATTAPPPAPEPDLNRVIGTGGKRARARAKRAKAAGTEP